MSTESELIARALDGDEEAFAELVRLHQGQVYRTAARIVGPEDAHDIAQDVFVKAYQRLDSFRREASLGTWLYRMSVNLSLNQIRGQKRELDRREKFGPGLSSGPPDPERSLIQDETTRQVWAAIDTLPERQRTAVVLQRFEGLSAADIGAVMGLSTGAVESLLHRAKQALLEGFLHQGLRPSAGKKDSGASRARDRDRVGSNE